MILIKKIYLFCFVLVLAMPSIAQTDVHYIKKADNFIKNFLSQLNNIHDNAFSEVILERESVNIILEEMIKDRDKTLLYDNISRSYINNNYKTVQDYMDSYITYFKSNLNKLPGKYSVQNSLGTFKEDTVYKDTSGLHKVCMSSRIVSIHYVNHEGSILHRSDTITFYILFEMGNSNTRWIIGSEKYRSRSSVAKIPDTDGDGILNDADLCPLISGLDYCHGCPDTDNDGICDKNDLCYDQKGTENCLGCPDTDGDGLCDKEDLCPLEKGGMKNNGCPEINIPVEIKQVKYPEILIPVTLEIKELLQKRNHEFTLDYETGFQSNFSSKELVELTGKEKLHINIKLALNRLTKTLIVQTVVSDLIFQDGIKVPLNSISKKSEGSIDQKDLVLEYKIDLNHQENLIQYLKTKKK